MKYNLKDTKMNSTLVNVYILVQSDKGKIYLLFTNDGPNAKFTIDFTL